MSFTSIDRCRRSSSCVNLSNEPIQTLML